MPSFLVKKKKVTCWKQSFNANEDQKKNVTKKYNPI